MKLIEAMKLAKELTVKADDLRKKVATYCSHLSLETPVYQNQGNQLTEWIQSHHDILKEIEGLRVAIQKTNLKTMVEIEIGGKRVKKCIAAWIHRRRDLAKMEMDMHAGLTDRNLKEAHINPTVPGSQPTMVTIVRYFDPKRRDEAIDLYRTEPGLIDRTLEVINATTDLIE